VICGEDFSCDRGPSCDRDIEQVALDKLRVLRTELEDYIDRHELFASSLRPLDCWADAPEVVRAMCRASSLYNVGPMASVAGVFSQIVGKELLKHSGTVIVENGGDIFARSDIPLRLALYAGEASPFNNKVKFAVDAKSGVGVCTSSATVGPSFSFGKADAVVAVADSAVVADAAGIADAAATFVANRIRSGGDIDRVLNEEMGRGILKGLIACSGDRIGFCGDIELIN
jgi:ApbE superfamily uncharacterized protein (UPF0280 family)